jgi:hypothetical protein
MSGPPQPALSQLRATHPAQPAPSAFGLAGHGYPAMPERGRIR